MIFWGFLETIYKRRMYHSSQNCVPFLFLRTSKWLIFWRHFWKRFINEKCIPFPKNFKMLIFWGFLETIYKRRMYQEYTSRNCVLFLFLRTSKCWYFKDFWKRFINEKCIPFPKNFKMLIFWGFDIYKRKVYHSSRNCSLSKNFKMLIFWNDL